MYTVEIDISDWNNTDTITITTDDFEKVQILQEFIEMQVEAGWNGNYVIDLIEDDEDDEEFDDEDFDDEEEDEPSTISTHIITTIDDNDPSKSSTVIVTTES
jgi:hypothetical protein